MIAILKNYNNIRQRKVHQQLPTILKISLGAYMRAYNQIKQNSTMLRKLDYFKCLSSNLCICFTDAAAFFPTVIPFSIPCSWGGRRKEMCVIQILLLFIMAAKIGRERKHYGQLLLVPNRCRFESPAKWPSFHMSTIVLKMRCRSWQQSKLYWTTAELSSPVPLISVLCWSAACQTGTEKAGQVCKLEVLPWTDGGTARTRT